MSEKYFVIKNSEGDTRVTEMTRDGILKELSEDGSGYRGKDVMSEIKEKDTNYWGDGFIIIKGKIVTPKIKKVVEEYDL